MEKFDDMVTDTLHDIDILYDLRRSAVLARVRPVASEFWH